MIEAFSLFKSVFTRREATTHDFENEYVGEILTRLNQKVSLLENAMGKRLHH